MTVTTLAAVLLGGCSAEPKASEPQTLQPSPPPPAALAMDAAAEPAPPPPSPAPPPDPAPDQDQESAMKQPFMFNEASLPEGFPPVGPVGVVMVKEYPAHRLAQVQADGVGGANAMFNPLFNHIKRNKIAMTAPVQMDYDEAMADPAGQRAGEVPTRPQAMAFFYRESDLGSAGVDPGDSRVQVVDVPAVTVLSVAVRGGYGKSSLGLGLKQLQDWLASNPGRYRVVGGPRYMGYNSPFVPWFLRMGEVQLPVEALP